MLGPINHVGIAVPDVDEAVATYQRLFDVTDVSDPIVMEAQGVKVRFINTPQGQIELLEPYGEQSPVRKFLEKFPMGGQHHVCFEVEDIWIAKEQMERRGASVLNEPRLGAHGTLVIFLHPKDAHGTLIELMETPKGPH
jgi:methylmalonyl-CoA/ethylmalonyl-CoA epimerase